MKLRFIITLRWLALAPAAIVGAQLSWALLYWGNRWTMSGYVDPDSLLGSIWVSFISTFGYAGALVYVSAYVAPSRKKAVSIVVATLATVIGIATFIMCIMSKQYDSLFMCACLVTGACVMSFCIVNGETRMPVELAWTPDNSEGGEEVV